MDCERFLWTTGKHGSLRSGQCAVGNKGEPGVHGNTPRGQNKQGPVDRGAHFRIPVCGPATKTDNVPARGANSGIRLVLQRSAHPEGGAPSTIVTKRQWINECCAWVVQQKYESRLRQDTATSQCPTLSCLLSHSLSLRPAPPDPAIPTLVNSCLGASIACCEE
jgi:hypothetical protein